ncbi:MAG: stalk domain-containing protein [Chitinophagales bacterium]
MNSYTMLPARFVAEALGYTVTWNAVAQQVVVGK